MKNIKNYFKGFTLVELIIVITILVILATIAFISFQGYTKDARDGIRMSDIKQIYNGLSIYKTQTEKTLLPDNYINIQSGTTTISYQGYAGASVLRTLKISGGKDPGTKDYYIYTTDVNIKKAQLMTYMETSDKDVQLLSQLKDIKLLKQANAITNSGYYQDKKIYVYGDKIGILTNNKVPLQETTTNTGIDITTLTGNVTTYFGGSVYSGGLSTNTGLTLINQINGAVNNTLPCSNTTYNGYNITSLQDKQAQIFTKTGTISGGTQTGSILGTCNNGTLSYGTENFQTSCNNGYFLISNNCTDWSGGYTKNLLTSYNDIPKSCNEYKNSNVNYSGWSSTTGQISSGASIITTRPDGIYWINPSGINSDDSRFKVYCDMTGGGYTYGADKTGLLTYMPMDNNYNDISGNGNNGICSNQDMGWSTNNGTKSCPSFVTGMFSQATKFQAPYSTTNSNNNYIQLPNDKLNSSSFTYSIWLKPDLVVQDVSVHNVVLAINASSNMCGIGMGSTIYIPNSFNKFFLYTTLTGIAGGGGGTSKSANYTLTNSWINLIVTYDSISKNASFYTNGSLTGTGSFPGGINYYNNNYGDGVVSYLGSLPNWGCYRDYVNTSPARYGNSYGYNGLMDDFMVFSRVISSDEIRAIYKLGQSNLPYKSY